VLPFPGCVLKCRLIGIIEGEQGNKKVRKRNDRIVAVTKQITVSRTSSTLTTWAKSFYPNSRNFS
jgi:hypothetical protein